MGFLNSVFGRSKGPALAKVDPLFALPSAALTLQVAMNLRSTGTGAIAFRAPEGAAFDRVQDEVQQLLDVDGPPVQVSRDQYGFTWFLCSVNDVEDQPDVGSLVTEMNGVTSSLQAEGWGPQLLCALTHFRDPEGRRLSLVYLFKQGTFYPFAPLTEPQRDNVLEFAVRDTLNAELPMETNLARWSPLWDAPGL